MRSWDLWRIAPFLVFFLMLSAVVVLAESSQNLTLDQVQKMIADKGYNWTAGRTSLSELSDEEFQQLLGTVVPPRYLEERVKKMGDFALQSPADLPAVFDWRDSSGVTPVKNQGSCGSCWDFCATAAFEAMIKIYDDREVDLSEQHVLSCNLYGGNCVDGGWMSDAYELFMHFGGIYESCMPYHANDTDSCIHFSCEVVDRIQGWSGVPNDVNTIKTALLTGPVASALTVYNDFKFYTGGCYENSGTEPINHGVLIIGWADTSCGGEGAWICKNSWGTGWGLGGFFYIKYESCNIGYGGDLINYTPAPHTLLTYKDHLATDSAGDNDGVIEPDETINLQLTLENVRFEDATNVSAILRTSHSGITVTDSSATFPDIPDSQERTSDYPHFTFYVDPSVPPGTRVDFLLTIEADQGSYVDSFYLFVDELLYIFSDDMEGGDNGWTHGYTMGEDDWLHGVISGWSRSDPISAFSGTKVWGNGLVGEYPNLVNNYLESPVVNCSGYTKVRLQFQRWLAVERGIYDHAKIFVNGNKIWENESSEDHLDYAWKPQDIDISSYADNNSSVKIKFQIASDSWINMGGWNIDDFALVGISSSGYHAPEPFSLLTPADEDTVWELSLDLHWQEAEDEDPGDVVNYILFYSTDPAFTVKDSVICSSDTFCTLSDLTDDEEFYWKVKAYDSYSLERWSTETFSFRTYLPESPGSFALLFPADSVKMYQDTLTLGWEEPVDPDPDDNLFYTLFYGQSNVFNPDSTIEVDSLTENNYAVQSLNGSHEGIFHFWKVKAFDRWGEEKYSDQIWSFEVFDINAPRPFSLLTPADEDTVWELSANLHWQEAEDIDPGDVVNYILFYSTDPAFTIKDSVICSTDTFCTISDLTDDEEFYWKVKAYDSHGLEKWSTETFSFRTYLIESPGSFALLFPSDSVKTYQDTLTLGWEEPQDPDPDDSLLYTLHYGESIIFDPGSTTVVDDISEEFYIASGLIGPELEKSYFWKIKAFDIWGEEKFSDQTWCFRVHSYISGDANDDDKVSIVDAVFIINYLFNEGSQPIPFEAGDANCDDKVSIVDVVYLINYLFNEGPEPGCL